MVVIACVAIIVVGPKDLPKMLRGIGKTVSGLKRMAGDFQKQFDDAIRDADLEDVKDLANKATVNPLNEVKKTTQEYLNTFKDEMTETEQDINKAANKYSGATDKLPDPVSTPGNKNELKKNTVKKKTVKKVAAKKAVTKNPAPKKTPTKKPVAKKTPVKRKPSTTGKKA